MSDTVITLVISGVLVGGVYSLIGLGVVLIYKATGVVNFSQGAILMIGALVGYFLISSSLFSWLAVLLTLVFCALLGYVMERICLRPLIGQPMISSVIVTLALAWAIKAFYILGSGQRLERAYPPFLPGGSFEIGEIILSVTNFWNFVIAILLFIAFVALFKYTKTGLAMRATADDHEVAQALGISVKGVFSQVWIIGAMAAGIAGILLGSSLNVSLGLESLGWKGLIVVLIGGLESIVGCIVVGPLIGVLESLSCLYIDPLVGGGMKEIVPFIFMLVVMIFRPTGLFGLERIERV